MSIHVHHPKFQDDNLTDRGLTQIVVNEAHKLTTLKS